MASNTYGAIKLSTAEDVGAVLKKKTGSADGYKPKEWADTINLMGLLPIRTASGTIAHFSDGADDVPMKSVVANIVPIQSGSGTPSPSNPRPISGTNELTLARTGANIWDEETLNGYYDRNKQGAFVSDNNYLCSKNVISVMPSTSYFWCIDFNATFSGRVLYFGRDGNYLSASEANVPKNSFTTPNDCYFIHWYFYKPSTYIYNNDVSINYPSTDTNYHAYTGSTYPIDLGQEIMGGTADVVGGVGEKTHDLLTLDGSEAWKVIASGADKRYTLTLSDYTPNNAEISDIFGYLPTTTGNFGTFYFAQGILRIPDGNDTFATLADFKQWLSENTPSFVLQLATPTDFTFTGQPIRSYLGVNNVWTDSGDTEVEYRADINLLIAELGG